MKKKILRNLTLVTLPEQGNGRGNAFGLHR